MISQSAVQGDNKIKPILKLILFVMLHVLSAFYWTVVMCLSEVNGVPTQTRLMVTKRSCRPSYNDAISGT